MSNIQLVARSAAARALTLLASPRTAAVVAALPERPHEWTTVADVAAASGLTMPELAGQIAGLCDAGVIQRAGQQLRLNRDRVQALSADVVADSPAVEVARAHPRLASFVSHGRWVRDPSSPARHEEALTALAETIPVGSQWDEKTLTDWLGQWHHDPAALRRALVDRGDLRRDPSSARYWRPGQPDRG